MALRPTRIVVLAIVAFAAGLLLALVLQRPGPVSIATLRATVLPTARALPPLDLVDHEGRPLGAAYFEGHRTLVFFGFTHCPDVCPTTLATLAQVAQQLADLPPADRPRVLLVSVDPARDTPARLGEYVRFFDPSFAAATGSEAAVADAARAFSVPYSRVPLPEGGYTMDHGSGVFLVGTGGALEAYFSAPHDAATIAADYRSIVTAGRNRK